jgi:hypothetical protein
MQHWEIQGANVVVLNTLVQSNIQSKCVLPILIKSVYETEVTRICSVWLQLERQKSPCHSFVRSASLQHGYELPLPEDAKARWVLNVHGVKRGTLTQARHAISAVLNRDIYLFNTLMFILMGR